jgi:hypothetical protein
MTSSGVGIKGRLKGPYWDAAAATVARERATPVSVREIRAVFVVPAVIAVFELVAPHHHYGLLLIVGLIWLADVLRLAGRARRNGIRPRRTPAPTHADLGR